MTVFIKREIVLMINVNNFAILEDLHRLSKISPSCLFLKLKLHVNMSH